MATTFEQAFKEKLKEQIEEYLPKGKEIVITNDINFKPLEEDPESIVGIIKSGGGTKSYVQGYDFTTYQVFVSFILDANYLQEFLGILNNSVVKQNGIFKNLNYSNETYTYQTVYQTPTVIGSPQDIRAKEKKVKVQIVSLSGTIVYTTNGCIIPKEFKIKIDGIEYQVAGVFRYELTYTPTYTPTPVDGSAYVQNDFNIAVKTYTMTLLKMINNNLHNLLSNYIINADLLTNVELKIDSGNYFLTKCSSLVEVYENQASVIRLVLMR